MRLELLLCDFSSSDAAQFHDLFAMASERLPSLPCWHKNIRVKQRNILG